MKVCKTCGEEIYTKDGDNECRTCEDAGQKKRSRRKQQRLDQDEVMRDLGLTKVRGALGGMYWE